MPYPIERINDLSETGMTNRRFEVYQLQPIILRIRACKPDRDLVKAQLIGRAKVDELRRSASQKQWLRTDPKPPSLALLSEALAENSMHGKPSQVLPLGYTP